MADYYLQFSEVLTHLNINEETWLQQQLQRVYLFGDREYTEDELPEGLDPEDADWSGIRACRDLESDNSEWLDFQFEFGDGDQWSDWGRHLWLYAAEDGNPEQVALIVQQFLKRFRPDQCWSLTYALMCSKLRVGEFSGGAYFVTAEEIRWQSGDHFVDEQRQAFAKVKDAQTNFKENEK